ncbi:MAG: aminodeoxychorismate synthase component [Verrucomicrobiota bacterium]
MRGSRFQVIPELEECGPAELAARVQSLPGCVFFDTAKDSGGGEISMLAACPARVWRGDLFDAGGLEALRRGVRGLSEGGMGVDQGLPGRVLAGSISYEGGYHFGEYGEVLVYRHGEGRWYGNGEGWRRWMEGGLAGRLRGALRFEAGMEREVFCAMVRRAQEYISAGDIYQVNLSHEFRAAWPGGAPWAFYEALRHYSPAPYGAYLDQGSRFLLSTSPELFLRISGREIRTRPIKGTRPRRADAHADERSAYDLITSAKEVAELVMITDLERNDLGQVCEWGSVAVRELLKLERYEQVFHLVSTVEGRLREELDEVLALRACFPGGSISGAPKKRAMEIIRELEGVPRGGYTGAIGWFGSGGESAFNIAIRTVEVDGEEGNRQARFRVGAGVVADSVPEREWEETWDKAAGILLGAQRLEWEEGGGVGRCGGHGLGVDRGKAGAG